MKRMSVPFGIKAVSDRKLTGHGSMFGNVDLGGDIVLPGAFKRTIAEHKAEGTAPAMLWQHKHDMIAGVWTKMSEDEDGLALEGEFADTQLGNESRTLAKMRAFRGLSIGYEIAEDGFDFDRNGNRLLTDVKLWEVSLVTFPMNPRAVIETVKSHFGDPRSLERFLRDEHGCSQKQARAAVHELLGEKNTVTVDDAQCDVDQEINEAVEKAVNQIIAGMIRTK